MKRTLYTLIVCIMLLFTLRQTAYAATNDQALIVYPEYDERIPRCYEYGVTVHQGNKSEELIVYNRNANGEQMSNRCFRPDFNRRFCEFAFEGEVRIDIEVYRDFTSYSILPSAKEYRNEYHDGIISVWLDQNDTNLMLRLDDEDDTILSIFADAPETYHYDPHDSSVLYVNEKWYDPNGSKLVYEVPANIKTIYIAPGCVLYSRLLIKTNDVTVCGHGMLIDPYSDYYDTQSIGHNNDRMVIRVEGSNITIKDIKLIDTQNWNIYLYDGYNHNILDVKILTARITTDAVAVGSGNVTIENCLFYVSDNVFTYNGDRGYHHIKNCLIGTTCAAFFPQHHSSYDIDFTDIYVFRANEGIVNNWYNPARIQSDIKHITFNNLDCVDVVHTPWIFNAHDMGDADKYFTFNNCHFANIRGDSNITAWNQTANQAIYVVNNDSYMHCSGYRLEFFNCTLDGKYITAPSVFRAQLKDGNEISYTIKSDKTGKLDRSTGHIVNHVYDKKVYIGNYLLPLKNQPVELNGSLYLPEEELCQALEVCVNPETSGKTLHYVKYISLATVLQYYTKLEANTTQDHSIHLAVANHARSNLLKDVNYTSRWNPYAFPNVILGPYVDTNGEKLLRCDVNSTAYYPGMFTEITDELKMHGSGLYTVCFDAKSVDSKTYKGQVRISNINYENYKCIERTQIETFTVNHQWTHYELQIDLSKWSTTDEFLSFIRICSDNSPGFDVLFKNIKMYEVSTESMPKVALTELKNCWYGVTAKWNAIPGYEYALYRTVTGEDDWKLVAITKQPDFYDKGVSNDGRYTYSVDLIKDGKTVSKNNAPTTCHYMAPPVISSVENGFSGAVITWNTVSGADGYYVYRKDTQAGTWHFIGSALKTSYTDKTAENGVVHYYAIKSFTKEKDGSIISSASSSAKNTIFLKNVFISTLTNPSAGTLKITNSKNELATGYEIEYCPYSTFSPASTKTVTITNPATLSKTINGLKKGSTYYVRVRAYKTVSTYTFYAPWSATKSLTLSK